MYNKLVNLLLLALLNLFAKVYFVNVISFQLLLTGEPPSKRSSTDNLFWTNNFLQLS